VKVRAFVPQARVSSIRAGDETRVSVDGRTESVAGKVSFISPRAEFTPPVIYSRESRDKLVFMVEIAFEPAVAATLHPGQPVDVEFGHEP
jgi:HlyD family secretion protein